MEPPAGEGRRDEPDETVAEAEDVAELEALDGVTDAGSRTAADAAGEAAEAAEQTVGSTARAAQPEAAAGSRWRARPGGRACRCSTSPSGARTRRPREIPDENPSHWSRWTRPQRWTSARRLYLPLKQIPAAEAGTATMEAVEPSRSCRQKPSRSRSKRSRPKSRAPTGRRCRERPWHRRPGFPGGCGFRPLDPRKAAGAGARPFGRQAALCQSTSSSR